MARVQLTININTDPVPGAWDNAEDFRKTLERTLESFPESYKAKVEITSPRTWDQSRNCWSIHELRKEIGVVDANRFVEWAGTRFFMHDPISGGPKVKHFWDTDLKEWMNSGALRLTESKEF